MAAACEEHGGAEERSGYGKLEGGSSLLPPLAGMGVKEDGFREVEAHSQGWAGHSKLLALSLTASSSWCPGR